MRRALEFRECEVIGVDRSDTGAEIELDLAEPAFDGRALAERVGRADGVIYLAASSTRGSSVDDAARANLRAIATAAVSTFEVFASRRDPAHFVYCSTYKVYGPRPGVIDPAEGPGHPDPHSEASAKAFGERLLGVASARVRQPIAIVRPTCVYGPGQHSWNVVFRFLSDCWAGRRPVVFGEGSEVRDDVVVTDVAYCLVEACLGRRSGAFHAAGGRAHSLAELAGACCRAVERLGGPAVSPVHDRTRTPSWWLDRRFSLDRTRHELGYEPQLLDVGLAWQAVWIRDGGDPARSASSCPPPKTRDA